MPRPRASGITLIPYTAATPSGVRKREKGFADRPVVGRRPSDAPGDHAQGRQVQVLLHPTREQHVRNFTVS